MAAIAVLPLGVIWAHARQSRALPAHHGDPDDRMLVAQALFGPPQLLTRDITPAPCCGLVILV